MFSNNAIHLFSLCGKNLHRTVGVLHKYIDSLLHVTVNNLYKKLTWIINKSETGRKLESDTETSKPCRS